MTMEPPPNHNRKPHRFTAGTVGFAIHKRFTSDSRGQASDVRSKIYERCVGHQGAMGAGQTSKRDSTGCVVVGKHHLGL